MVGPRRLFILFFFCMNILEAFRYIIVPGMGGSVIYNQNQKKIWPPDNPLVLKDLDIKLDPTTQLPNVPSILKPELGPVEGIKIDNAATFFFTKNVFYSGMIQHLEKKGHEVLAFPYDFRFLLYDSYSKLLYQEMKHFIEKEKEKGPFIFICHSLGGLVFHHFLCSQSRADKDWAKKYIQKVYYLNVPFGGAPISFYAIWESLREKKTHQKEKRLEAAAPRHLLPILRKSVTNMHLFSGFYLTLPLTSDPFYRIGDQWIYKEKQMDQLFAEMGGKDYSLLQKFHQTFWSDKVPERDMNPCPEIPQIILYGSKLNTTVFMDESSRSVLFGDGDGLIPISSLTRPFHYWKEKPIMKEFPGIEHSRINNHKAVLRMLEENS